MGLLLCGRAHFQRDCNARKNTGMQSYGKGKQRKSWSKSEGKGERKENKGKSKEVRRNQRCDPRCQRLANRKLVYQVLKTRNQRQARKLRNLHRRVPLTILGFMMVGVTLPPEMYAVFFLEGFN